MRFAQILYDKAHWIFEADEKPEFAPNIILVDITGQDEIKEGWDYDEETRTFLEPVYEKIEPVSQIDEIQAKILVNTETLISMKEMEV